MLPPAPPVPELDDDDEEVSLGSSEEAEQAMGRKRAGPRTLARARKARFMARMISQMTPLRGPQKVWRDASVLRVDDRLIHATRVGVGVALRSTLG
jgi:hypothetical protein